MQRPNRFIESDFGGASRGQSGIFPSRRKPGAAHRGLRRAGRCLPIAGWKLNHREECHQFSRAGWPLHLEVVSALKIYPWYAAWDLAFHTIAAAIVDLDFAKHQLEIMGGQAMLGVAHMTGRL
jgi:hypothetical protein